MTQAIFDTMLTVAFGSITSSYATLGSPTSHAWSIFKITNNTNGDMLFSFDGTNNRIFVPANSFTLYDLSTNAAPVHVNDSLLLANGTQFYIKYSTSPSSGAVWIEGVYAKGN
jgi:hypothetical protein